MSEEQNDSPAFRLRPRRSAPKSYYAVRLEYSANPAAFIRERPRANAKRKVFTQKTGSNSTKNDSNLVSNNLKLTVVTKEERDREERHAQLHRETSQSITTNTLISPFIQRLHLDQLEPDSLYEHNYITLRIKEVETISKGRLMYCMCHGIEPDSSSIHIGVYLNNEYADPVLVKPVKIISIAKFRTGTKRTIEVDNEDSNNGRSVGGAFAEDEDDDDDDEGDDDLRIDEGKSDIDRMPPSNESTTRASDGSTIAIKFEDGSVEVSDNGEKSANRSCLKKSKEEQSMSRAQQLALVGDSGELLNNDNLDDNDDDDEEEEEPITVLPFDVIVKYEELVGRSTNNSNRGTPTPSGVAGGACSSLNPSSGGSVERRPLIPFVSITDMIDQPTEPFVEMSCSSPPTLQATNTTGLSSAASNNHDSRDLKKVKFTANLV